MFNYSSSDSSSSSSTKVTNLIVQLFLLLVMASCILTSPVILGGTSFQDLQMAGQSKHTQVWTLIFYIIVYTGKYNSHYNT